MDVTHRSPCPHCRDKGGDYDGDNLCWYEDGHGYCFACQTWYPAEGQETGERKERTTRMSKNLLPDGEYQALAKRKLNANTLTKFGYSISELNGQPVHIAPYYDQQGELCAQHIRFPDKSFIWRGAAKGVQMFGQHLWKEGGKRIVITEGEIDAMTVSQLQDNKWAVVSLPSGVGSAVKSVTDNLEYLESFENVILCFDNDEPGRDATQKVAPLFTPGKVQICVLPLKDASDMMQAGRGAEVIQCLWQAKTFRPDGIVAAKDLLEELLTEPPKGYTTPYPKLNEMLQGVRKGELFLATAGSGIGKSTLIHEIARHFVKEHGLTVGIMALEESKKRTLERYVGMELNIPIHAPKGRAQVTKEQLTEAFNTVAQGDKLWFYDHFGSTDIENLLTKIRYMIKALRIDFLVLDHISIVVSGLSTDEGERKTIDMLMTALRSLIEETGVGVLAIVHLKRPDKGKSYNEGRQVSLTDLRGSGSLEQLSDVVVALERNQQDENNSDLALVRVLKSRLIGVVGTCDVLRYYHDTGRLLPVADGERFFKDDGNAYAPAPAEVETAKEGERDF